MSQLDSSHDGFLDDSVFSSPNLRNDKGETLEQQPVRPIVQIPEREATELAKRLRHSPELVGVALSVYGYIAKTGVRALHVAVDYDHKNYDLRYKADTEIEKLERNAIKRIRAQFDM